MKDNEVPQDGMAYKGRDTLRKLMYATDKEGNYTGIPSLGWEAEHTATKTAWDEVQQDLNDTLRRVHAGEVSPLAYYMKKSLMDVGLLAKYVKRWKWNVKRHMRPDIFAKLHPATLREYADALGIDVETLKNPPAQIAE